MSCLQIGQLPSFFRSHTFAWATTRFILTQYSWWHVWSTHLHECISAWIHLWIDFFRASWGLVCFISFGGSSSRSAPDSIVHSLPFSICFWTCSGSSLFFSVLAMLLSGITSGRILGKLSAFGFILFWSGSPVFKKSAIELFCQFWN